MAMNQVERHTEKDQQGHGHEPGRKTQRVQTSKVMAMKQEERHREKDKEGHDHEPGRKRQRERPARCREI